MLHSRLFKVPVLAALCGTLVLGADPKACTTFATAGVGESCATIAATNGIDMYDFIGLNPDLISCVLTAGTSYCIGTNGTATTTLPAKTTSSAVTETPTGDLIPSPDGSDGICGENYTCFGSVYGDCCSANGYCGNSTEYCGEGCNSAFGRCGGGEETCPAAETVTIVQGPGACTVTLLSITTMTVSQLQTVTGTVTATATVTVTSKPTTTQPSAPRPTLDDTNANCKSR
jgi:hypothetical protein